ncbi:MAG: electron transfer flavoprotein subunit alpha/FixB family protein [bacterium]
MNVLVFIEQRGGEFRKAAIEALCEGRRLAEGGQVTAVVIGDNADSMAMDLQGYGPNRILTVNHPQLESYSTEGYTKVLATAIQQEQPDAILMAATAMGKDLAPRLAARLGVSVLSDVTKLTWADGKLEAVRPIYAGKLLQTLRSKTQPSIATTRPKAFLPTPPDASKSAEIVPLHVEIIDGEVRAKVMQILSEAEGMIELTEADFVVSGGRGMKGAENFKLLEDLANVLGAAIGASRAAVDSGWRSHGDQVGQTGKVVAPTLYIACGISGAIQHLAGMTSSKVIVAINKDPDAPIFKIADYGIVGDVFEIVPALTAAIRAAQ